MHDINLGVSRLVINESGGLDGQMTAFRWTDWRDSVVKGEEGWEAEGRGGVEVGGQRWRVCSTCVVVPSVLFLMSCCSSRVFGFGLMLQGL